MGVRFGLAKAVSAVSTWGLKHVFHRPAANFPGKIALYVDPNLLGDLRNRVKSSICVVGTNGKTTVTNLLADSLEADGFSVTCNRTGANLDSGVSTALLHSKGSDWGVFECDELWLAKILPFLQSNYVLLLNLFRDQLDRVGEIDHIQESIANALGRSPETTLVYNADDPLCQAIADQVKNPTVPFGLAEDLGLAQNTIADARMCQQCSTMLEYKWRQYGQLGNYFCPQCGFSRPEPLFTAKDIKISAQGSSFVVAGPNYIGEVSTNLVGTYMVYNLLAISAVSALIGVDSTAVIRALEEFDPQNGRLQNYDIEGRSVLLNLAKNPTGFNQNLKIVMQGEGPKAVAFFINDKEADGRDVSWLWDIDFQELSEDAEIAVYAGGIRRNDMQVRLKYAGVEAGLVEGAKDFLQTAWRQNPEANLYVIANYTALPAVKDELDCLQNGEKLETGDGLGESAAIANAKKLEGINDLEAFEDTATEGKADMKTAEITAQPTQSMQPTGEKLVIAHMYPTLLNLYGDSGNITVLVDRARKRGIETEVLAVNHGDELDFSAIDIVYLGGGPDREQHLASEDLQTMKDDLREYVEDDGVLLAICGGFQIIGKTWLMGEEIVPGLELVDMDTKRCEGGSHNRLVDNVALSSPLASLPVVGYENHAGRTFLGEGIQPFGHVVSHSGHGNNDTSKADGILYRNVIGTYLHGPLLAKNPEVADNILQKALDRKARRAGNTLQKLPSLDDSVEIAANRSMGEKLGVR